MMGVVTEVGGSCARQTRWLLIGRLYISIPTLSNKINTFNGTHLHELFCYRLTEPAKDGLFL